jgi:hypothetical protein
MDVIANTTDTQGFATQIAADCRQIGVHTGSCGGIEPRLAILRTKYGVNDDFAEGLRHGVNNGLKKRRYESRLQRWDLMLYKSLGRCPRLK